MKNKVTVKITKSRNDHLWYRNKIGQEFKVRPVENAGEKCYEYSLGENRSRIIYGEDCEEV